MTTKSNLKMKWAMHSNTLHNNHSLLARLFLPDQLSSLEAVVASSTGHFADRVSYGLDEHLICKQGSLVDMLVGTLLMHSSFIQLIQRLHTSYGSLCYITLL